MNLRAAFATFVLATSSCAPGASQVAHGQSLGPSGPRPAQTAPEEPFRTHPPAARSAAPFAPPPVTQFRLKNGIPVVLVAQPSLLCAVRVVAMGGLADAVAVGEGPDVVGEMLSAMPLSTMTRDAAMLDSVLASQMVPSPRWNFSYDGVAFSTVAFPDKIGAAIDVLADIVLRPAFEPKAFERRREQDARSLDESFKDTGTVADRVLAQALLGGSPYGSFQTPARTRAVSRSAVVALHARVWRPERLAVILAGNLTQPGIEGALNAGFGGAASPGTAAPVPLANAVLAPGPRLVVVDVPGTTIAAVAAGFVGPPPGTSDADATETAMSGIARAPIGRLTRRVRDALGLVPWLNVTVWWWRAGTLLGFRTRAPTAQVAAVLTEADRVLRAVAGEGLSADELAVASAWADSSFTSWFETAAKTAETQGRWLELALPLEELARRPKSYTALTTEAVRQASARYLDVNRMRVVVVGDLASLRGPLTALGWGPIQVSDSAGAPVQAR